MVLPEPVGSSIMSFSPWRDFCTFSSWYGLKTNFFASEDTGTEDDKGIT